jgi:tRNA pseudouridine38-40 synthase
LKLKEWNPAILYRGLNSLVPPGIRILSVQNVDLGFHAQRSAIHKQYSYFFQQGPAPLPHIAPYSWWIRKELNVGAMNLAAESLKGVHDFKPFQASGAAVKSTVREVFEAEVCEEPIVFPELSLSETKGYGGGTSKRFVMVRFRIVGTGFLKQMVRSIAGTLLEIGEDRRDVSSILQILKTKDRGQVGITAPGRGLWLERVTYNNGPIW